MLFKPQVEGKTNKDCSEVTQNVGESTGAKWTELEDLFGKYLLISVTCLSGSEIAESNAR